MCVSCAKTYVIIGIAANCQIKLKVPEFLLEGDGGVNCLCKFFWIDALKVRMSPWHGIWLHTSMSLEICPGLCLSAYLLDLLILSMLCYCRRICFVFQQIPSLLLWSSAWRLVLSLLSSSSWEPSARSAVRALREVCTSQLIAFLHVHHQRTLSAPQSDKEQGVRVFMSLHRNRAFISISSFSLSVCVGLGGMIV